jgi:hypothetical protein
MPGCSPGFAFSPGGFVFSPLAQVPLFLPNQGFERRDHEMPQMLSSQRFHRCMVPTGTLQDKDKTKFKMALIHILCIEWLQPISIPGGSGAGVTIFVYICVKCCHLSW